MSLRSVSIIAVAMALAACGDSPATTDGGAVQGEIRGGTISDAMLPLDELQSRSPPIAPEPEDEAAAGGSDEAAGGEAEAAESDGAPAADAEDTADEEPAAQQAADDG